MNLKAACCVWALAAVAATFASAPLSASDTEDTSITAQVKAALVNHRATRKLDADVETRDGVVTLTGAAKKPSQKSLATKIASSVPGVADVKNEMEVSTATLTTEPDNSKRNVRDRNDRTLTPLDQSNTKADLAITRQIRRDILAEEDMSMNAQNIKIITVNGRVTLRGPVKTAAERTVIGEIAERAAQPENVDNQLEVTSETKQ